MTEELRYLTVEEREEYKRLAREYGIKGYSPQITMIYPSQSILPSFRVDEGDFIRLVNENH